MKGVNIRGVHINNLRYANDTVFLAEGAMFLQALLTAVNEKGKPYDMQIIIIIILAVHATAGRWPPQLAPCTSILGRSHPLTANGFLDVISPSPFGSSS